MAAAEKVEKRGFLEKFWFYVNLDVVDRSGVEKYVI